MSVLTNAYAHPSSRASSPSEQVELPSQKNDGDPKRIGTAAKARDFIRNEFKEPISQ